MYNVNVLYIYILYMFLCVDYIYYIYDICFVVDYMCYIYISYIYVDVKHAHTRGSSYQSSS